MGNPDYADRAHDLTHDPSQDQPRPGVELDPTKVVVVQQISSLPPESWGDCSQKEGIANGPTDEAKRATNAALFKLFQELHAHGNQVIEAARRAGARPNDLENASRLLTRAVGSLNMSIDL